jgi:hypothetical protein
VFEAGADEASLPTEKSHQAGAHGYAPLRTNANIEDNTTCGNYGMFEAGADDASLPTEKSHQDGAHGYAPLRTKVKVGINMTQGNYRMFGGGAEDVPPPIEKKGSGLGAHSCEPRSLIIHDPGASAVASAEPDDTCPPIEKREARRGTRLCAPTLNRARVSRFLNGVSIRSSARRGICISTGPRVWRPQAMRRGDVWR